VVAEASRLYETILVVRSRTGDEAAFREIVELYQARLGFYLRKMLGHGDGAEDALQDVWFDVVRSMARLEDPAAFRAWIYRIARDRAYRELRRRQKAPRSSEGLEVVAAEEPAALYAAEDVQRVYDRLDGLEPHHREVLVLRFIEDMSYEDMARVIDCPLGTVRSRIHYAKEALRRAIGRKT